MRTSRPASEKHATTMPAALAWAGTVVLCGVLILGLAPGVRAEGGGPTVIMQPEQGTVQPQVGQPVQPMQPAQPPAPTARQGRGLEYGGHLIIPIFLSNPIDTLPGANINTGVGIGIQGRIGWEFGEGLTLELNAGGTFNPINGEDTVTGETVDLNASLLSFWIGGGARYAFLGASALVPFVGAGAGVYFWDFCAEDRSVCTERELSFGLNAQGGIIYELNPFVGLEAGVQFMYLFANDQVFEEAELVLSPFIGATFYY